MPLEYVAMQLYSGTNPAANVEATYTVPGTAAANAPDRFLLLAIYGTLVTDANAANRRVRLTIEDGFLGVVYLQLAFSLDHVASTTTNYTAAPGLSFGGSADAQQLSLPQPTVVRAGSVIRTITTNRQAGDNWAALTIHMAKL